MSGREREADLYSSLSARHGFFRATTRDEREREAALMHYVGFDNAALLRTEENSGISVYTNGIVGCNVLVMTAGEGTYMAHIKVDSLFKTPAEKVQSHTLRTIDSFRRETRCDEMLAYVVTDGRAHRGLTDALARSEVSCEIVPETQFGIRIGALSGGSHINSTFNIVNQQCENNNRLPRELQWNALFGRGRYMDPTASSLVREAVIAKEIESRSSADKIRERFVARTTIPVSEKHYMDSTASSRARVAATREEIDKRAKDKGRG